MASGGEGGGGGGAASGTKAAAAAMARGRDAEEKRTGWSRDPYGGWVKENAGGGSTSNLANANISNNLRNRRRTSATTGSIPNLHSNGNGHISMPAGGSQRGSSASPRAPHSKGFWVQEPDDFHSRWVTTATPTPDPDPASCGMPLTWPPAGGSGGHQQGREGGRAACLSQPSSPHKTPATPPPMGCSATLPKVYKSHATWVSTHAVTRRRLCVASLLVPGRRGRAGVPALPCPCGEPLPLSWTERGLRLGSVTLLVYLHFVCLFGRHT